MAIPNLPTDNLYKFLALTGFFMLIGSLGYIHFYKNQISLETARIESKLETLEMLNTVNETSFSKQLKNLENEEIKGDSDSLVSDLSYEEFKTQIDEMLDSRKLEHDNYMLTFIAATEERMNTYEKAIEFNKTEQLLIITALLGFILMLYGFILWYFKLQRHQDILIKHQALKALNELTTDSLEQD